MRPLGLLLIVLSIAIGCENTRKSRPQQSFDAAEGRSSDSLTGARPTTDPENRTQEYEKRWQGDTLLIMDSQLTSNPFGFGDRTLAVLLAKNVDIQKETVENRHVPSQIDTLYHIRNAADYFKVYKTPSENFLSEAQLKTNTFKTRHGFQVGMHKSYFLQEMRVYDVDTVPANVRLKSAVVNQYLDLRFKDDHLTKISFKGYVD